MSFTVPNFNDLREALLRDLKNQLPDADTGPDSDFFVRVSSVASAVEGLYQHQSWITRQIFPDTADSDYLELHARVRGLTRKSAVGAEGTLQLQGTPGTSVPAGLVAKSLQADNQTFVSTESGTVDQNGWCLVAARAAVSGTTGNVPDNTIVELSAAPSGIASQAILVTMTGGTNSENDNELLVRLLDLIRRPPAGGNQYDYRRWAMEIEGVSSAYVYPLRRGIGTVDIVITSAEGLPSQATIDAVQQHIDDVRPVTAKHSLVLAPQPKTCDVRIQVKRQGVTLEDIHQQISNVLASYFNQLAPGDTAYKSRIEALVSDLNGVVDRMVITPSKNCDAVVDANIIEWARLGNITIEDMTP